MSHDYSRVIATMFAGSLVAILLGMALAFWLKMKNDLVNAVGIVLPLLLAIPSGLMGEFSMMLKFQIQQHAPLLNQLNPMDLVTDALFQLSFYPTYQAFNQTLSWLIIYCAILVLVIYFDLRRERQ